MHLHKTKIQKQNLFLPKIEWLPVDSGHSIGSCRSSEKEFFLTKKSAFRIRIPIHQLQIFEANLGKGLVGGPIRWPVGGDRFKKKWCNRLRCWRDRAPVKLGQSKFIFFNCRRCAKYLTHLGWLRLVWPLMTPLRQVQLEGKYISLVPLNMSHAQALADVANVSRETYALTSVPYDLESARQYIQRALDQYQTRSALPFVIMETLVGKVVGTTRFLNIEFWQYPEGHYLHRPYYSPHVVEIGATWLGEAYQRTGINTDTKLVMLKYAFEEWHVLRVAFKTDVRNMQSRKNIERVGARFDGIIRAHMPSHDGGVRDSAFYSIAYAEWPDVKKRLSAELR